MQKITYNYSQSGEGVRHDKDFYAAIEADFISLADIPDNSLAGKLVKITGELNEAGFPYSYSKWYRWGGDYYDNEVVRSYLPSAFMIYALDLNSNYFFGIEASIPLFPEISDYIEDSYSLSTTADADFSDYYDAANAWYDAIGGLSVTRAILGNGRERIATITAAEELNIIDLIPIDYAGRTEAVFEFDTEVIGSDQDDVLETYGGYDTLDGGIGADQMTGGDGDDIYHVNNSSDVVIEAAGEGTDTVISSATSYALSDHVENLKLTGTGEIDGTGNRLDNLITGNDGNNQLDGLAGNDTLDGGVGADQMTGGIGDDTYYVDDIGDTMVELSAQGTDTVISSISFALKDQNQFLENLTLAGSGNINGTGNGLNNTINGNSGNNILNGAWGNDTLNGGAGNDIFIDDGGIDRMVGGAGDDIYYVGNVDDTTIEVAGQGTDTVFSSVDFFLWNKSQHIENLTLVGAGDINAGGNALGNTIIGNEGNNILNGGLGADQMVGGGGDDTFHVDNIGDTTIEMYDQGFDTVVSTIDFELWKQNQFIEDLELIGTADIDGCGNALANILTGNAGNNVLNGGVGADRMVGGAGNDTYHVDNAGDTTIEVAGQGTDSVISSVSYFLWNQSQHIENLTLIGTANISGGGNGLANTITGNAGNNVLNGGGNADRMVGGQGNDTYYVDNFGDTTIELAGEGTDLVMTSVGFALRDQSQHIENLTLIGTGHIYGTGNGLANTITGNAGNNGLNGAWGNDTLIGGAGDDIFRDDAGNDIFTGGTGADTFFFLSAGESDRITDFEDGIDNITIGLGVNSFANVTVTDSGADTILTFGSNTVTL